jgi:hypothetical protein
MTPLLMKSIIEKNLWVKKAGKVQGSVRIHFPSPSIQDIVLTHWAPVNVFGRIGMTVDQVKLSNLETLFLAGHIKIVQAEKPKVAKAKVKAAPKKK